MDYCICNGKCSTCLDIIGADKEVECPDCPIHGDTDVAKESRREILDNLSQE